CPNIHSGSSAQVRRGFCISHRPKPQLRPHQELLNASGLDSRKTLIAPAGLCRQLSCDPSRSRGATPMTETGSTATVARSSFPPSPKRLEKRPCQGAAPPVRKGVLCDRKRNGSHPARRRHRGASASERRRPENKGTGPTRRIMLDDGAQARDKGE